MLPTQSPDDEHTDGANGLMSILTRWAPISVIIIIILGTIWYAVRTEPAYQSAADSFQRARKTEAWEDAAGHFTDDFHTFGGDERVVRSALHGGFATSEFHMSGNRPSPSMARASEGLAVVQMNEQGHFLCLRREDEQWRVRPSPFLEYYLRHDDFMPQELKTGTEGSLLIMPKMPDAAEGQARIYVEPVWTRSGPRGRGMRVLLSVQVTGANLQTQISSLLTATAWKEDHGESNLADRLLWSNIFPDVQGTWPLQEGHWWLDLEWDEVPDGEFSLIVGSFVSGSEKNEVLLQHLSPPDELSDREPGG